MSCTLHDVQLPQSASASITTSHCMAISWRRSIGAGLVNVGLAKRRTRQPRRVQLFLDAVEEHVAARLADVEQPDGEPVEAAAGGAAGSRGAGASSAVGSRIVVTAPPPWSPGYYPGRHRASHR